MAHPNYNYFLFPLFSRWDNALAAMLFVRTLERPSLKACDALLATVAEVTFFAIDTPFLFLS